MGDEASELIAQKHRDYCLGVCWQEIHKLSPARFGVYTQFHGPSEAEALAAYIWNMEVSASLLPAVHAAEVLLRNEIDRVLMGAYGPDWYVTQQWLRDREIDSVDRAKISAYQKEPGRGRVASRDDVIVELGFRFWTNLLLSEYASRVWNLVAIRALPNLPRAMPNKRRNVHRVFAETCDLRNRICHGERIIHKGQLDVQYAEIMQSIGWISGPKERVLRKRSQFAGIWRDGLQECRDAIEAELVPPLQNHVKPA